MKRLCLWCMIVCVVCLGVVANVAVAESLHYAVPQGQTVTMYFIERVGLSTNTAQFQLPYGYTFATTGGDEDGYTPVEFCGVSGFVPTSQLAALTASSTAEALPEVKVTVDDKTAYRFVTDAGTSKRETVDLQEDEVLTYLGTYTYNSVDYYAVRSSARSKLILYVVKAHTNTAEVEATIYPQSQSTESATANVTKHESNDSNFTWVRFVLILGIIIPLITIVLMILRPRDRRRTPHRVIYDEEEGEDYDSIDEM